MDMPQAVKVKFGHFEFDPVQDLLGEGPLSEVYKAVDENLGRTVALKILRPHAEIDPEADTRFAREAKHTSRLEHPNIATVYEYGEDSGRAYIAMEYCEGRTLDRYIKDQIDGQNRALGIEESVRIAKQLTASLAQVHRHGLIHRDLKPANIMILHDGTLKLLDFGICRASGEQTITQHGMLVGTVLYMSPEQVRGDELDARSDIFAMGAVLYHAMTGQLPFPGESFPEVCMAILDCQPRPLSELRQGFPEAIEAFVMRCLAPDPARRYENAGAAHGALLAIVDTVLNGKSASSNELTGNLLMPPMSSRNGNTDASGIATGVRKDLAAELQRSTGLSIELLESTDIPPRADKAFVIWGTLDYHLPKARLDLVIEQAEWASNEQTTREVWREQIEHADQDEWGLQAQLVRSAVRTVRRRISEHNLKPVEQVKRHPEEAEKLSARGHEILHRGMTRHLLSSVALIRRALEADPYCARAHATMAEALVRKYLYWDGDNSFLREARESARRALALDPDCAAAHVALGFEYHLTAHHVDACREYRMAIQTDQQNWLAHRLLGSAMSREGNLKEASPLLRKAIALRPTYISSYDHLYNVLQRLDRYEEAMVIADDGIAAARKHLRTTADDQDARLHLAMLLARMGSDGEAQKEIEAALARAPKDGFTSFLIACVYALLGRVDESMESLLAAQGRGYYVKNEIRNPEFDILRGLPEFQRLG